MVGSPLRNAAQSTAIPMTATRISAPKIPSMIKTVFRVPDIVRSSVWLVLSACEYAGAREKVYPQISQITKNLRNLWMDLLSYDPAAAHDFIAAIKDRCLARRDGALGFVEDDAGALIFERCNRRRGRGVAVTHAHLGAYWFSRIFESDPIRAGYSELVTQQLFRWSSSDAIRFRIDRDHVQRPLAGDTDAATLPNRVAMNAFVTSNYLAGSVDDLTRAGQALGRIFCFEISIDEPRVIAVRHEADLLRLLLF